MPPRVHARAKPLPRTPEAPEGAGSRGRPTYRTAYSHEWEDAAAMEKAAEPLIAVYRKTRQLPSELVQLCDELLAKHPYSAQRIGAVGLLWGGASAILKAHDAAATSALGAVVRQPGDAQLEQAWCDAWRAFGDVAHATLARFTAISNGLRAFAHTEDGRELLHRCALCLGDITRYRDRLHAAAYNSVGTYRDALCADTPPDISDVARRLGVDISGSAAAVQRMHAPRCHYMDAVRLRADHGQAYNALGIVCDTATPRDALLALYYYLRALHAPRPFDAQAAVAQLLQGATAVSPDDGDTYGAVVRTTVAAVSVCRDPTGSDSAVADAAAQLSQALGRHLATQTTAPAERLYMRVVLALLMGAARGRHEALVLPLTLQGVLTALDGLSAAARHEALYGVDVLPAVTLLVARCARLHVPCRDSAQLAALVDSVAAAVTVTGRQPGIGGSGDDNDECARPLAPEVDEVLGIPREFAPFAAGVRRPITRRGAHLPAPELLHERSERLRRAIEGWAAVNRGGAVSSDAADTDDEDGDDVVLDGGWAV